MVEVINRASVGARGHLTLLIGASFGRVADVFVLRGSDLNAGDRISTMISRLWDYTILCLIPFASLLCCGEFFVSCPINATEKNPTF